MCGLAGIARLGAGAGELRPRAARLSQAIAHRGPDGQGLWATDDVAFAHRRLAILDPSDRGHQPMHASDGRWTIMHNGEIYNHLELRTSLSGPWTSTSDAETILRLLSLEGIGAVPKLAGMFAVAAWDSAERRLYLIRDRLGIKPLHFAIADDSIVFASEPSAIAAADEHRRRLDYDVLPAYLAAGYPPPGRTLFKGVRALGAGEILTWHAGVVSTSRYWRLPARVDPNRSQAAWQEEFEAALVRSVQGHLLSDVPIGVFLSGGMDSSAVVLAASLRGGVSTTLTATFRESAFDESAEAQDLAERLGLPWQKLVIEPHAVDELLPQLARHADLPCCDSSAAGTWALCEAAATSVKVVLSGDGADEVLGGYPTHRASEITTSPLGGALRLAAAALHGRISTARPSPKPVGFSQKVTRLLRYARHQPLDAHLRWRTLLHPEDLAMLLPDAGDPWDAWRGTLAAYPAQPLMNRALAMDVEGYLVQDELTRVDRMGMAHGLELRVPLLDHELVELAFRMPYEIKSRRGRGKRPLSQWLERHGLGHISRRPKRGFNHPVAAWFCGDLGARLEWRLRTAALAGVIDRAVPARWLAAHRAGREDRAYELWTVLFLLEWGEAHGVTE